MTLNEVILSVIIPVYNTDIDLLSRCINSVLNQSFENYQILVVFNGCTKQYMMDVKRKLFNSSVKYYEVEVAGVSKARNIGIRNAKTKYICFVDADDELEEGALESAVDIAEAYNADVVSGALRKIYADHEELLMPLKEEVMIVDRKNVFNHLLSMGRVDSDNIGNYLYASPCAKIYRTSILDKITYDEKLYYMEDVLFNMKVALESNIYILAPISWYKYYQNSDSVIHSFDKRLLVNNKVFLLRVKDIWSDNTEMDFNSCVALFEYIVFSIRQIINTDIEKKEAIEYITWLLNLDYICSEIKKITYRDIKGAKAIYLFLLKSKWLDILYRLMKKLCFNDVEKLN